MLICFDGDQSTRPLGMLKYSSKSVSPNCIAASGQRSLCASSLSHKPVAESASRGECGNATICMPLSHQIPICGSWFMGGMPFSRSTTAGKQFYPSEPLHRRVRKTVGGFDQEVDKHLWDPSVFPPLSCFCRLTRSLDRSWGRRNRDNTFHRS